MRVYQALTRPKLHRGAEVWLSTGNNIFVLLMLLVFFCAHVWWALLVAAVFYWPMQWLLRVVARHDPQYLAVYLRAISHPLIREAHGDAYSKDSKPTRILPKPSRWVK